MKVETINMKLDGPIQVIILLIYLVQTILAEPYCPAPEDGQCPRGCYYVLGGECLPCSVCPLELLNDPESYQPGCTTFPRFCGFSGYNPPVDYPTGFSPVHLPEEHEVYYGQKGGLLLFFFQEGCPVVAKLCIEESVMSQNDWFSFQKACLNITGADGTRYTRLEDVRNHSFESQDVYFIAASSTDDNGSSRSSLAWVNDTVLTAVFRSNQYLDPPDSKYRYPVPEVPRHPVIQGYRVDYINLESIPQPRSGTRKTMISDLSVHGGSIQHGTTGGAGVVGSYPGDMQRIANVTSAWRPRGQCNFCGFAARQGRLCRRDGSQSRMSDKQKNFIRGHTFMYNNVNATAGVTSVGSGFLFETWGNFTSLETVEKKAHDGLYYEVVFIGTEDGRLLKVIPSNTMTTVTFLEENYVTKDSAIGIVAVRLFIVEEFNEKYRVRHPMRRLNVTTTDGKSQHLSVESCKDFKLQCTCERDPFCYWTEGGCEPFDWSLELGSGGNPIPKMQCDDFLAGITPGSALHIIDKYDRRILPTTPSNDAVNSSGNPHPKAAGSSGGEDNNHGHHIFKAEYSSQWLPHEWRRCQDNSMSRSCFLATLLGVGAICIFLAVAAVSWFARSSSQYGRIPNKDDFERTWTTVTCNLPLAESDIWILEGNKHIYGKAKRSKVTFQNLNPLTTYNIGMASHNKVIQCRTLGPSFSNHCTGKDTYSVDVTDWMPEEGTAVISLRDGRGSVKRRPLAGTSVQVSALLPNMAYDVYLEVGEGGGETLIKKIETRPEDFAISPEKRLAWNNLSRCVQGLSISCCQCVFKKPHVVPDPSPDGHLDLPQLPHGVEYLFVIKGKFADVEFEHVIATVEYTTPKMVLKKKPMAAGLDDVEGIPRSELVRDGAPASDYNSVDSRIRSAPVPVVLPDGAIVPISPGQLAHVATFMQQRSQSVDGDQRVMIGDGVQYFENNHITINMPAPPTASYHSQASMPSSSSSIRPLRSSESVIEIENGDPTCFDPCHKTLADILELHVEWKRELTMRLKRTPTAVEVFRELLGYAKDGTASLLEEIHFHDSLYPLGEGPTLPEEVAIWLLLYRLVEYLRVIVGAGDGNPGREAKDFQWIVQNLSFEGHGGAECAVCAELRKTCDHLVECR